MEHLGSFVLSLHEHTYTDIQGWATDLCSSTGKTEINTVGMLPYVYGGAQYSYQEHVIYIMLKPVNGLIKTWTSVNILSTSIITIELQWNLALRPLQNKNTSRKKEHRSQSQWHLWIQINPRKKASSDGRPHFGSLMGGLNCEVPLCWISLTYSAHLQNHNIERWGKVSFSFI